MHPTSFFRRRLLAAGLAALVGSASVMAQAPQPPMTGAPVALTPADVKVDAKTGALIVPLGGVGRFEPEAKLPIKEITNRNEDVLDARVDLKSPSSLILAGRAPGASRLTLVFAGPNNTETRATYDVVVQPDYELLKNVIKRAFPTAQVDVVPGVNRAIILTGAVSKPEDSDMIQRIVSDAVGGNINNIVNGLQVGGSQHVLIDTTIAQVDRSEVRQRGFNFGFAGTSVTFTSVLGGVASANFVPGAGSFPVTPAAGNIAFGIVPTTFAGVLQALRVEGLAKLLSEPKVITHSGRPAFIRVGGQQAVLSASSGINGPGAQLQAVGTEMEVLPIVYGNGKIYLEINPRVTSVNNARGISTAFGFTPGFNEQQTRASVMLESGQTFAIGGLIENTIQANATRVPYVGDLPVVGTLFSYTEHQERETELLVLVTPRLVEPMDCGQVPRRVPGKETRSPDDYELFVETLLEAPRGQRKAWTHGTGYNAAYKCDPTYGKYPCIGGVCAGGANCATGTCAPGTVTTGGVTVTTAPAVSPVPVVPVSGTTPQP